MDDDDESNGNHEISEIELYANPISIKERIDESLQSLADLPNRSNKELSRTDIITILARDISEYYGYVQELTEFLLNLFPPAECVQYMDASDKPRPLVIRANTLKISRKDLMEHLSKRGAVLEAITWSKVAIKVTDSSVPIGATPEYLAGYYMLQSAASLNPVMALAPLPGERILDMSSAPGGKTSFIAQLMKNSGTIIANDLKEVRQKATVANLHRLGVKNTTVCCYDGRKINQIFKGFDRVLLDAPCSGLGVISRDQSVKLQRSVKDIQRIAHLQKELLRAAIDAVDPKSSTGGIIVYSTCSISTEENEQVVDYILSRRHVKLIDTGLEVGTPGFTRHMDKRFHPSLVLTRRFYPHVHNMDGFFVAKFKKFANGVKGEENTDDEDTESVMSEEKLSESQFLDNIMSTEDIQPQKSIKSKKVKNQITHDTKKTTDKLSNTVISKEEENLDSELVKRKRLNPSQSQSVPVIESVIQDNKNDIIQDNTPLTQMEVDPVNSILSPKPKRRTIQYLREIMKKNKHVSGKI
eukprot:gene4932-6900_t